MIKEIPILFSTSLVQAILEGRKSQTRRIMKPQIKDCDHSKHVDVDWKDKPIQWSETALKIGRAYCGCCGNGVEYSNDFGGIKCPYGKPGDLLWVRETFTVLEPEHCIDMDKRFAYKASCCKESEEIRKEYVECGWPYTWKPSIHMPKVAARIWLQVTDVRVERLKDISEEDAMAEGIELVEHNCFKNYNESDPYQFLEDPIGSFKSLWVKINGADSWQANPFVWVVSFTVLSTTGKPDYI